MSDKQKATLLKQHPNLHYDTTKGHLVEASTEFAEVASQYPIEATP